MIAEEIDANTITTQKNKHEPKMSEVHKDDKTTMARSQSRTALSSKGYGRHENRTCYELAGRDMSW